MGEIKKYGDRGIKLVTWAEKDKVKCLSDRVFMVYLQGKVKGCSCGYLSLEELENQLVDWERR